MESTTSPIGIATDLGPWFINLMDDATKQAWRMGWDMMMPVLAANWGWILLGLFLVFTFVSIKAAFFGRWGSLGSFLYNFFYFGALFVIGLIWGPEVFAGDLFKAACAIILYPVCYLLAGYILDKTGARRRRF